MAGILSADYIQPQSNTGLTILTPAGGTIASVNIGGIYSATGNLLISSSFNGLVANTGISGLIINDQIASVANTKITGNINVANTQITGNIISTQITSVSNTQITGTITNNVNSFLVTANTLSDGTNSTSATNPIRGSAKAWVNFDGTLSTPITPRSSYNVTSITKNGTGDYTITFTNAFSNVNYTPVAMGMRTSEGNGSLNTTVFGSATYSNSFATTTLRVVAENDSGTRVDPIYYGVVCFA
jgi:hypothetical protein